MSRFSIVVYYVLLTGIVTVWATQGRNPAFYGIPDQSESVAAEPVLNGPVDAEAISQAELEQNDRPSI